MENKSLYRKIVLKVNLNCCKSCPRKLEKALSKLTGVSSFTLKAEENLVSLLGILNLDSVVKLIYKKISKRVELVSSEPQLTVEEKPEKTETSDQDNASNNESSNQQKEERQECYCRQDVCYGAGTYGYMPNYLQEYSSRANPWYPSGNSHYLGWYSEQPSAGYGNHKQPTGLQPPYWFTRYRFLLCCT